ncbi:MAG: aldo/keto reductase, partial [Myxococcales bacterium]|nr:aldo/keto reductase [Myxococcales bacterium]
MQRLASRPDPTDVLQEAARLGVTWLDTADVYGAVPGDAERLLRPWVGRFRVCTKVGLVRDGRAWRPDGRPSHLLEAAERSRERLGVDCLDLCLWHAPDPRTEVASSARALARVEQRGIARAVGVANLTAGQLREAARHVRIAALQVEVSPVHHEAVRSGVIEVART